MPALADRIELAVAMPAIHVQPQEYLRLLGYPRGFALEGRALDLADAARAWYAKYGRPWIYARQAETFAVENGSIFVDGRRFTSRRLETTLQQAGAHTVILVAVGAGPEAEEEARRLWTDEKPDEYFFLEMYASAVVEHLTTATGARLCECVEPHQMAVLPHYSPGYAEWDVAEQPRLLELIRKTRSQPFPSKLEAMESGMLLPKKSQLALFGLTRHTDRLRPLTSLVPCESCSFGRCQYRRAPWRRPPRSTGERVGNPLVLDLDAAYSVNRKALQRWAQERLTIHMQLDGSLEATFCYDGTTCTNMGRPLAFRYRVTLGSRDEGYPIFEQDCAPMEDDTGHTHMCQYIADPDAVMGAIEREKPLRGERLNAVLSWRRNPSAAGCFCEAASRDHKWGLVLETIHFALAQREAEQGTER